MDTDFSRYLLYIVLTTLVLVLVFTFMMKKFRGRTGRSRKKADPITFGNVSVFFDVAQNITIIPYVKDKYGVGRALGSIPVLRPPYSKSVLGQTVREAMQLCRNGVPCRNDELMPRLGFRDWKDFSEGKKNLSIHYQESHGVVFNTTSRKQDGSYQFNHAGFEKIVSQDIDNESLGELIMALLNRCRG